VLWEDGKEQRAYVKPPGPWAIPAV